MKRNYNRCQLGHYVLVGVFFYHFLDSKWKNRMIVYEL